MTKHRRSALGSLLVTIFVVLALTGCSNSDVVASAPTSTQTLSALATITIEPTAKLKGLSKKARELTGSTGGINTTEKLDQYHKYAKALIDILRTYVPNLLKQEDFFNNVFKY